MASQIKAEIRGLKETQRNLTEAVRQLQGPGLVVPMRNATLLVQRDARTNAPVDTGRLRASITPDVRIGNTVEGVVGSNVVYAPYQELGYSYGRGGRFFRQGRHYLQRALENNAARIAKILGDAVAIIARKANNQ